MRAVRKGLHAQGWRSSKLGTSQAPGLTWQGGQAAGCSSLGRVEVVVVRGCLHAAPCLLAASSTSPAGYRCAEQHPVFSSVLAPPGVLVYTEARQPDPTRLPPPTYARPQVPTWQPRCWRPCRCVGLPCAVYGTCSLAHVHGRVVWDEAYVKKRRR